MNEHIHETVKDLAVKITAEELIVSEATARMTPLKAAVNSLCLVLGEPPRYDLGATPGTVPTKKVIPPWKTDQFFGRPLAGSVVEYMEAREVAGMERPASIDEIYNALCQGGFKFKGETGNPENQKRAVAISLTKNTAQFTKVGDKFALLKWYGKRPPRKAGETVTDDAEEQPETPAEATSTNPTPTPTPTPSA